MRTALRRLATLRRKIRAEPIVILHPCPCCGATVLSAEAVSPPCARGQPHAPIPPPPYTEVRWQE